MERDCSGCKRPLTGETACPTAIAKGGYCRACRSAYKSRARRKRLHDAREGGPCRPIPVATPRAQPMTYSSLHSRLRRERGRAGALTCVDCGRQADEWSYRGGCPAELTEVRERDGRAMPYSLDLSMYDPRCKPCHVERDGPERHPCGVSTCGTGVPGLLDYCSEHQIGPRRSLGVQLGAQLGVRDEHGRTRSVRTIESAMTHKKCNKCGEVKSVRGFSTRGRNVATRPDPYKGICLECDRIKANERYRKRIASQMADFFG